MFYWLIVQSIDPGKLKVKPIIDTELIVLTKILPTQTGSLFKSRSALIRFEPKIPNHKGNENKTQKTLFIRSFF